VILVPSRLAYGRDLAYYNPMANSKRTSRTNGLNDQCFVFNFELKKVENR